MTTALVTLESANAVTFEARAWLGEDPQACVDEAIAAANGSECVLRGRFALEAPLRVSAHEGHNPTGSATRAENVVVRGDGCVLDGTFALDEWIDGGWNLTAGRTLASGQRAPATHWTARLNSSAPDLWSLFKTVGYEGEKSQNARDYVLGQMPGELCLPARWPNVQWPNTAFEGSYWANDKKSAKTSTFTRYANGVPGLCTLYDSTTDHPGGERSLSESGLNATGAKAVLNIGHWFTHTGIIHAHTPGDSELRYYSRRHWKVPKFVDNHNAYFLEGKDEFLDAPLEWTYDPVEKLIKIVTPNNVEPSTLKLRGRRLEYAFTLANAQNVTLKNFDLFALGIWASADKTKFDMYNITWENVNFWYPSAQKRMLGYVDEGMPTSLFQSGDKKAINIDFEMTNCTFYGSESTPTRFRGGGMRFRNNNFLYNDWTAVTAKPVNPHDGNTLPYTGSGMMKLSPATSQKPNEFIRNDIHVCGNSAPFYAARNSIVRYNYISGGKDLQNDGSAIQGSGVNPKNMFLDPESFVLIENNWVKDTVNPRNSKYGIRFDRSQDTCDLTVDASTPSNPRSSTGSGGFNGTIRGNVCVETSGVMVKGNNHTIENNLIQRGAGVAHIEDRDTGMTSTGKPPLTIYREE